MLVMIGFKSSAQTLKEMNDSVSYYYNREEYKKGIPIAEKLAVTIKQELGEVHPDYIRTLNGLAGLYEKEEQYEKAESSYLKIIEIQKKVIGIVHPDYAETLNNLGMLYFFWGQYEKAEPLYLQAKEIWSKVLGEADKAYDAILYNLAILYSSMTQYVKAEPIYLQLIEIRKKILGESNVDYAEALNKLGMLYIFTGYYEKAEPLFKQAIEIWGKTLGEKNLNYASGINNLALLYTYLAQYEKAEPLYMTAIETLKIAVGKDHPEYATTLNNLGLLYVYMGKYDKAELFYIQAKETRERSLGENHPDYANSLSNMGMFYITIGDYEKAKALLTGAREIRKNVFGEDHPDYATSLNNLAGLYNEIGEYEKSEPFYLQAAEIRKEILGESHPDYAESLDNIAGLYERMGREAESEQLYLKTLEIRKNVLGEDHPEYAMSLNNLAYLYNGMGQYEKSETLLLMAIEISRKTLGENHLDFALGLSNLAFTYIHKEEYLKAEHLFIQENKIITNNLFSIFNNLSEKEKGSYLANNFFLNNSNNSLLYNYRKTSSLFYKNNYDLQLLLKSLSLVSSKNVLGELRKSTDTIIQRKFAKWQTIKSILAKQYSLPVSSRRSDLTKLEEQAEVFEKELTRSLKEFKNLHQSIQINTSRVCKELSIDEKAIEFVSFKLYNKQWTDSIIYAAYVLAKNDSNPIFIPLFEEKQLRQLLDSTGKSATNTAKAFYRGLDIKDKNTKQGEALYKLIWQPLEPYLKGVKRISYSPAGKLYSIAFHALPIDSTSLLLEKYQLQQYTSTRQVVLRETEAQAIKPKNIVLFGDANFSMDSTQLIKQQTNQAKNSISTSVYTPSKRSSNNSSWPSLPGTAEEVDKIKRLFTENKVAAKIFINTTASEENLKALSGNSPQILHIATHGFFLPEPDKKKKEARVEQNNTYTLADDPLLRTGLLLSGGNYVWSGKTPIDGVEDGIATAYEISQLNLSNTELVVLSACETALGDVKGSEGVFGLQRAFKMAGVKKMIVSLWQVPDKETAELMTTFYGYWMKGKTINDAFTQAQSDMRKKYAPFYWAAFVLVE